MNFITGCDGASNTVEDPFGRVNIPNKIKNVNLKVFVLIQRINESKTVVKHISWKFRCEFDGRKCNLKQKWNIYRCYVIVKDDKTLHMQIRLCVESWQMCF